MMIHLYWSGCHGSRLRSIPDVHASGFSQSILEPTTVLSPVATGSIIGRQSRVRDPVLRLGRCKKDKTHQGRQQDLQCDRKLSRLLELLAAAKRCSGRLG